MPSSFVRLVKNAIVSCSADAHLGSGLLLSFICSAESDRALGMDIYKG
jgi:hypothetical protein